MRLDKVLVGCYPTTSPPLSGFRTNDTHLISQMQGNVSCEIVFLERKNQPFNDVNKKSAKIKT